MTTQTTIAALAHLEALGIEASPLHYDERGFELAVDEKRIVVTSSPEGDDLLEVGFYRDHDTDEAALHVDVPETKIVEFIAVSVDFLRAEHPGQLPAELDIDELPLLSNAGAVPPPPLDLDDRED